MDRNCRPSLNASEAFAHSKHDVFANTRLGRLPLGIKPQELLTYSEDQETPDWPQELPCIDNLEEHHVVDAAEDVPDSRKTRVQIESNLKEAKRQAYLRQLRLRVPAVGIAAFCGVAGLYLQTQKPGSPSYLLGAPIGLLGFFFGLLGFLPSDRRAIPIVNALVTVPMITFYALSGFNDTVKLFNEIRSDHCTHREDEVPCWFVVFLTVMEACQFICATFAVFNLLYLLCRRSKAKCILDFCFVGFGWMLFCNGCFIILQGLPAVAANQGELTWQKLISGTPGVLTGLLMVRGSNVRVRVQSWFMSRGQEAAAAAAIAELLGDRKLDDVLSLARTNFLCVRADHVTFEAMADSFPNPQLEMHTQKAEIGFVDAFFSHSWHDDAVEKWKVLQEFREDFKWENGREPTLWIDKYCINQNGIDDSLACLPVFLSGCKTMLVACGKSYLTRLWCLVELFVFIEMGGLISNLDVRLLGRVITDLLNSSETEGGLGSPSSPSSRSFMGKLSDLMKNAPGNQSSASTFTYLLNFDPCAAVCSNDYDTDRLHAVLQTSGHEKVSNLVFDVFVNAHPRKDKDHKFGNRD